MTMKSNETKKMKTRFLNIKTGAVLCSLMVAPAFVSLAIAEPKPGKKMKSETTDTKKSATGPSVSITVKGLACPFCVHGLEKKLKKVKGVHGVSIDLKSGISKVTYAKGSSPDLAALRTAIKKAGFTPGEVK